MKCNANPKVVRALAAIDGCGFDCASSAEMDQVLALGVDPSRIIYANPCRSPSALRHALSGERAGCVVAAAAAAPVFVPGAWGWFCPVCWRRWGARYQGIREGSVAHVEDEGRVGRSSADERQQVLARCASYVVLVCFLLVRIAPWLVH